MMISSSAPASANWAARTPPPTIQTFRPPAPALRSSTNSATGPRTKVTSAPLGAECSWWVNTQHGVAGYGQVSGSCFRSQA